MARAAREIAAGSWRSPARDETGRRTEAIEQSRAGVHHEHLPGFRSAKMRLGGSGCQLDMGFRAALRLGQKQANVGIRQAVQRLTCSPLWRDKAMAGNIHVDELDAEQRKQLSIRKLRESQFSKVEILG